MERLKEGGRTKTKGHAKDPSLDGVQNKQTVTTLKSSSDTTIYAPALKLTPTKINKGNNTNVSQNLADRFKGQGDGAWDECAGTDFNSQINNFVDQARREAERIDDAQPGTSTGGHELRSPARMLAEADQAGNEMVIQAKKFKLATELPRGKQFAILPGVPMVSQMPRPNIGISDDEFFHLTCHVDSNTKVKIERGEYIEAIGKRSISDAKCRPAHGVGEQRR